LEYKVNFMPDWTVIALLVVWVILSQWVFPKLGIPT